MVIRACGSLEFVVGKLLCEYRFHRPRSGEEGDPSCLIKHLSAYLLHYAMGAVLCERRIVFVGRNEEVLSVCIHGIMALLSPFKWPHIFIPILPECLIQVGLCFKVSIAKKE